MKCYQGLVFKNALRDITELGVKGQKIQRRGQSQLTIFQVCILLPALLSVF